MVTDIFLIVTYINKYYVLFKLVKNSIVFVVSIYYNSYR